MAAARSMALVLLNTQGPKVIPQNSFPIVDSGVFSCLQEALYYMISEV